MDLKNIFDQAKGIQDKIKDAEEQLTLIEATGESGGGMVKVAINGKYEIISLEISDQAYQEGKDILSELVVAAINDASEKVQEVRKDKQQELLGTFMGTKDG